jgi:uncharacterized protein YbjT (DUF2867 family)
VRPSILDGARSERRPLERSALVAMRALGRLLPARWRPVAATDVAAALRDAALRAQPGLRIIESDRIVRGAPAPGSVEALPQRR